MVPRGFSKKVCWINKWWFSWAHSKSQPSYGVSWEHPKFFNHEFCQKGFEKRNLRLEKYIAPSFQVNHTYNINLPLWYGYKLSHTYYHLVDAFNNYRQITQVESYSVLTIEPLSVHCLTFTLVSFMGNKLQQ